MSSIVYCGLFCTAVLCDVCSILLCAVCNALLGDLLSSVCSAVLVLRSVFYAVWLLQSVCCAAQCAVVCVLSRVFCFIRCVLLYDVLCCTVQCAVQEKAVQRS